MSIRAGSLCHNPAYGGYARDERTGVKLMQRRPYRSFLSLETIRPIMKRTALISKIDGQVEFNGVKINVTDLHYKR